MSGLTVLAALIGSALMALALVLYLLTFLPGDVGLGGDEFLICFVPIFPLWGGMFYALAGRGALGSGPRRRRNLDLFASSQSRPKLFEFMPRSAKVIVPVAAVFMAVGFGTAFRSLQGQPEYHSAGHHYWLNDGGSLIWVSHGIYLHDLALQSRLFLGGSVLFLSIATLMAIGEWSRRRRLRAEWASQWPGWEPWPEPSAPRPRLAMRFGAFLVVLVTCALGLGLGGGLLLVRLNDYFASAQVLPDHNSVSLKLPAGQYVVYLRCPDAVCSPVSPDMLAVRSAQGTRIAVTADPSSDRLSLHDTTYEGVFSFSLPGEETYLFRLRAPSGLQLLVDKSNGSEALALTPWIALTAIGVLLLVLLLVDFAAWFRWRYRIGEFLPPATPQLPPSWSANRAPPFGSHSGPP